MGKPSSSETGGGRKRMRNRPKWTELPEEVMASILSRLGAIDILLSAQEVCMKWRQICKDPLMWRTIDMRNDGDIGDVYDLEKMCRYAVDRSCGNLVDITIEFFGTDELLHYITQCANGIKRLQLLCCDDITDEGLSKVASKLPLLEELDITFFRLSHKPLEVVGRSCPLLKSFKLNDEWDEFSDDESDDYGWSDEDAPASFKKDDDAYALAIAGTMHGLHHLQLFANKLSDDGLRKILDCCPHLESLDLRHCFNLNLRGDLRNRCFERIKHLWCPHDPPTGCFEFVSRYVGYCDKWTELPDNITASILSRLGAVNILESAQKVCMKWRKICKDPMMWRTIDMRNLGDLHDMEKMCRHVIDRSCGNLVDINIDYFGTDELLQYMTDRSCGIKRLRLVRCSDALSDEGLIKVARRLPLLEDLDISLCELSHCSIEVVGRACPLLKSFKLNKEWQKIADDLSNKYDEYDEYPMPPLDKDADARAIARTMHGLHDLQLFGNQLTNKGLRKILNGCPHLESLDLRYCFNLDLEGDLGRRCAERIKNLRLPIDLIDGDEFTPLTDWCRSSDYDYADDDDINYNPD